MNTPTKVQTDSIFRFVLAFLGFSLILFPLSLKFIDKLDGNLVTACLILAGSLSALVVNKASDDNETSSKIR